MKKLYEEASVQDIAAAIREKTGGAQHPGRRSDRPR